MGVLALAILATACGTNIDRATLEATSGLEGGAISERSSAAATDGFGASRGPGAPGSSAPGARGRANTSPVPSGNAAADPGAPGFEEPGASQGEGTSGPRPTEEILLGSFGTGTGPIGANIADAPVAVRAWTAWINARGGVAGRQVRVVMADDGGDPAKALAIARRMVEEDGVLAFFGLYGVTTLDGVAKYLDERRIPVIGALPAPPTDVSPMFFVPEAGTVGIYRGMLMTLVRQSKARKIAVVYCREADTCSQGLAVQREYAPLLGIDIVYEAQVSIAQPDFTAEVLAARNAGATAVVVIVDFASTLRLIKSAKRQGWDPVFVAASNLYTDQFTNAGGADVEGTLGTASTPPYSLSPRMADYRDAVATHVPGGRLGDYGAMLWLGGKLFERVAAEFGPEPSRQDILAALHGLRNETLGGLTPPLTFPQGAHGKVNLCQVPIRVSGGSWVAPFGDQYVCAPDP